MEADHRAVLVTGASSGIGRHIAERLAGLGHRVYATARRAADLEALAAVSGVEPIELDVRDPDQIARARARIERMERTERTAGELFGLVNNAGLGGLGPLATWSPEELREIFEVNVFGPVQMSTAFLPLLLAARGRIVNIGSQGGSIAMGNYGPYTMTKHALEAFTVALADEVAPHGVRVSIVQPGGVVSAIGENGMTGTVSRLRRAQPPFDQAAQSFLAAFESPGSAMSPSAGASASSSASAADTEDTARRAAEPESATNRKPSSPEIVAVAVIDALFSANPRPRYLVGTRWEGERVLRMLAERLLDANDCPTLAYSVDELVERIRIAAKLRTGSGPS